MNKILRIGLKLLGAVIAVAAAVLVYIAATFDANSFKEKIVQAVQESKQRTLRLDGDIKLSFFPNIGASLAKVSLSESGSEREFAAIESARVSLALLPLLRKQWVIDEIAVSGLRVTLVRHKDGTSNIDDLLGKDGKQGEEGSAGPVKLDVASVAIVNANLDYQDEREARRYTLRNLQLKAGRIANGVNTPIDFSASIQASEPALDIAVRLKTLLAMDLGKQQYRLHGMEMQLTGAALDLADLKVTANGDVGVDRVKNEFNAKKFVLIASGKKDRGPFAIKLDIPVLNMTDDQFSGENIALDANTQGAAGNIAATLNVPRLEGNAQAFKVGALVLDAEIKQSEQSFKLKAGGQATGNFKTRQFNLDNINVALNAAGDKFPSQSASSEMHGNVHLDALKQSVQANFSGGLLQSQVKAKVGVQDFSRPAIQFDVELDQLNADLYLPASSATPAKSTGTEASLDFSGLRKLNLDGSLRIGALQVMNVKSSDLRVDVQAHNGIIKIGPLSANLYQGHAVGAFSINTQATPVVAVNQNLSNVNVAMLGKDAAGFDTLEGRGNVGINLLLEGRTISEMKRSASGSLYLNLVDGAIKGINVAKKIRDAKNLLGAKPQTQSANKEEKTDFSELKAGFKVTDGIAHNEDLSMKSPLLRLSGGGDINIGNDSINYLAKATLAKTLEGQGGQDSVKGVTVPLRVSGPFADLKYTLDFAAMVGDASRAKVEAVKAATQQQIEAHKEAVKQKIDEKKTEVKNQIQDKIKNKLKGLFK